MKERRVRILVAKPGLDGHDRGAKVIAYSLRDAGFEVIFMGIRQTADRIVNTAIQEDVDFIGYRIMAGDPIYLIEELNKRLKQKNSDIPVIIGGIIRAKDFSKIKAMGVAQIFIPGSLLSEIANFMKTYKKPVKA